MPLAVLADHRSTCAGPKYFSTAKYEQDSYATALRAIFHSKRPFPLTSSVLRVMKTWPKNPYTTIIVDFEFDAYLLNTLKREAVFQIAATNVLGEWIAPPTSINHGMSTLEFFEKLKPNCLQRRGSKDTYRGSLWKGQFAIHYGPIDDLPTRGISWSEIGDMIDSYTTVKTRELADLSRLEQNQPRFPMLAVRIGESRESQLDAAEAKESRVSSFPPNLGVLHRIVFPERRELSKYWHNLGVDVTITKELIEAYFHRAGNRPVTGKIDSYVLIDPGLPSFSVNERMPDESAQVAVIDEESEEFDDNMLYAEIDRIDMEEDDFFDEYVLEQMANDGS
ncbi:hypothetical protein GQ44DRAFT_779904 [Phaeosphaeriaceae sp. PMI808]|nr:hypothetical protein GQ44DRAFT_779904 [Phaeosphaeriaceae sp. PMI808]